jgi:hypothetical protein
MANINEANFKITINCTISTLIYKIIPFILNFLVNLCYLKLSKSALISYVLLIILFNLTVVTSVSHHTILKKSIIFYTFFKIFYDYQNKSF